MNSPTPSMPGWIRGAGGRERGSCSSPIRKRCSRNHSTGSRSTGSSATVPWDRATTSGRRSRLPRSSAKGLKTLTSPQSRSGPMLTKLLVRLVAPICILLAQAHFATAAEEPLKIGLIVPLTGGQASTGKQLENAVKLYLSENGDTVAGRRIEVVVKDDGAVPEN